jgi:hypothetical protein
MKHIFLVEFKDRTQVTISAACATHAKILAQAEQIKNGGVYDVRYCVKKESIYTP